MKEALCKDRRGALCKDRRGALCKDRRGAVAVMIALFSPAMLGMAALVVDTGFWTVGRGRLQMAADAGAMGASYLLSNSGLKQQANYLSTFQAVALAEAQGVAPRLVGTIGTPAVAVAADWKSLTVTLTSPMPSYFNAVFGVSPPVETATATVSLQGGAAAPGACVLTVGTTGTGIQVDNMGTVNAVGCPVFSNSSGTPSIYLNSGTLKGSSIGAVGTITQSNSGSNSMSPSISNTNPHSTAAADPETGVTAPVAPSQCDATNANLTSYGQYRFTPHGSPAAYVFCGNTTIGGNGSTDTFDPGIYYVVNGNLTFNNATLPSQPTGVSFVMTGNTPGSFSWTNYSNTKFPLFTGPTTGPTAGVGFWMACNGSGQTASFQGGSTLPVSGLMYMPCASVDVGNNAQVGAAYGMPFSIVAKSIYAHGSGGLVTAPDTNHVYGSGSVTASVPVLTN